MHHSQLLWTNSVCEERRIEGEMGDEKKKWVRASTVWAHVCSSATFACAHTSMDIVVRIIIMYYYSPSSSSSSSEWLAGWEQIVFHVYAFSTHALGNITTKIILYVWLKWRPRPRHQNEILSFLFFCLWRLSHVAQRMKTSLEVISQHTLHRACGCLHVQSKNVLRPLRCCRQSIGARMCDTISHKMCRHWFWILIKLLTNESWTRPRPAKRISYRFLVQRRPTSGVAHPTETCQIPKYPLVTDFLSTAGWRWCRWWRLVHRTFLLQFFR